jgi:arylsulfatase
MLLQMDPGEQYDMVFNGAAPKTAGVLGTSPGRYAGADNGWTMVYPVTIVQQLTDSFKKYPNIPTSAGGASIGSELPEFVLPTMVVPER